MTNKELLPVNYKWVFVEEEQKDDQGAKSITIQGIDVAINQVFDILPIQGRLETGEQQTVTVTYYGLNDRKFNATAVCVVEGGPEYEVNLLGEAAKLEYRLDKNEIDFGDILYDQIVEREVYISNPGRVAGYFNFNLSQIARPTTTDAHPLAGIIQSDERQKVMVKFRTGIPDFVEETILVEAAHFQPTKLRVRARGIFLGLVLATPENNDGALPRMDEEDHV